MDTKTTNIRIMKRPEVEDITGLSRATIYAKIAQKDFPAPIKLGERSVGWIESEVQNWLSNRIVASRG